MANTKQVMDVSKPGNATPDPTARPVIVGHGPMMKDPMVHEEIPTNDMDLENSKPDEIKQNSVSEPVHEKVLQPTQDTTGSTEPVAPDTKDAGAADKTEEQAESEDIATPGAPDAQDMDDDDVSNGAVVDAVIGQATQKKRNGELSDAEKAEQEHIQQLIADKTYFVPIGQVSKRRNRRAVVILLVVLLLTLVAVNFVLDVGLIDISGVPHTDVL